MRLAKWSKGIMATVTIEQAPQGVKDIFNKGFSAFERGNLDYAIDLLMRCVEIEPGLLRARKFLRAAQVQRLKQQKPTAVSKIMRQITGLPLMAKVMLLTQTGKGGKALVAAEKLLCHDPLNVGFLHAFADAADKAGLPEAAIQTLEIARDHFPDNAKILLWLGDLYVEAGSPKEGLACFEKLVALKPNDPDVVKKLKDTMALNSMAKDGWVDAASTGGTFREMVRDTDEAATLEREAKAVKTDRDADSLIDNTLAKIEAEPENINYYRSLARLYVQRHAFDEAMQTLERALEISPGDPELDQLMASTRAEHYDFRIAELAAAGDEAGAEALKTERMAFVHESLTERIKRYPNDLRLRYEMGVCLFDKEQYNEAIQQFQLAQRSPKHRTKSLYYLAIGFKVKGQYDLALEQLQAAAAEMVTMDNTKMDIIYEMGQLCELMGKTDQAAEYYKIIYQVDIGYKDIADKIEQLYKRDK